ncbi:hypothetical protein GIB67_009577 [Kingdonia uniflora]|uniref:Pentatricopeptide repeat-containing protein n=1 Tax=Kingdonia uniflora TaxID=39325 RepID=A0A7J7LX54_9MAGN|nr:hypothetical protein GIB67_009577 [Kingdonia uniflora]
MPDPNSFLYNNMIKGFVDIGSYEDALTFYFQMLNNVYNRCNPNNFTFPFVLKACSKLTAFEEGKVVHGQVLKLGFSSDVYVETSLVDMYGSCREVVYSKLLFDRMCKRDVVAWNAILASYTQCGVMECAKGLFEEMPVRNVSSWTTMIGGYIQIGDSKEALECFYKMQKHGMKPDKLTIMTVLSAVADLGSLEIGKRVHEYMDTNKIEIDGYVGTALIDMYSKCGNIQKARKVFDGIRSKNISCYNAMISCFGIHGLGDEALRVFREVERTRIGVDDVTMIAVLTACSHSGLVDMGCEIFNLMRKDYGIEPKMEHYGCMVDLLGREGRLDEAMGLIESIEPDIVLLGTLAFACRIHGNVELGEELARRMSELDPTNSGLLVLKSNLYAVEGRWKEAAGVRRLMMDKGIRKKPGTSWIEINNVVHEFVAGDASHSHSKKIYSKLLELSERMKLCIPTTQRCQV